jgi:thioredoxin reductase (NADPH)
MRAEHRIVIIGAGPAGLAAALQLKRQGYEPLLLEGNRPGGLLHNANLVENYPGFPGGIKGPELVEKILVQAGGVGVEITSAEVLALDWLGEEFQLRTTEGNLKARVVVVASGTRPKPYKDHEIPAELAHRLHYEVVPLLAKRRKRIIILGAGDAALDYALNLSRHNQVVILNRGRHVRGLGLLWERVQKSKSIEYHEQAEINSIQETESDPLLLKTEVAGNSKQFVGDYLIAAIGRRPATSFLEESVKKHLGELTLEGKLYLIGDVCNDRFRQTAIAVGDGLRAAMEIDRRFMGDE